MKRQVQRQVASSATRLATQSIKVPVGNDKLGRASLHCELMTYSPLCQGPSQTGASASSSPTAVSQQSSSIISNTLAAVPVLLVLFTHPYSKLGGHGGLLRSLAAGTLHSMQAFPTTTIDIKGGREAGTTTGDTPPRGKPIELHPIAAILDSRGAGRSDGSSTITASTEVFDLEEVALHLVQTMFPSTVKLIIVGSSAGAAVSGSALPTLCKTLNIHGKPPILGGWVALAYPHGWASSIIFGSHYPRPWTKDTSTSFPQGSSSSTTSPSQVGGGEKRAGGEKATSTGCDAFALPKLFLLGDSDSFTSQSQLRTLVKKYTTNATAVDNKIENQEEYDDGALRPLLTVPDAWSETVEATSELLVAPTTTGLTSASPSSTTSTTVDLVMLSGGVKHFDMEMKHPKKVGSLIAYFIEQRCGL